jgi:hypothetical protein
MQLLRELPLDEPHDTHLAARFRAAGSCSSERRTRRSSDRCRPPSRSHTARRGIPGPEPLAGRVERRLGGRGRLRDGAGRACQRRRRLDPHPGERMRARRLKPSRGRTSFGPGRGGGWAGMSVEHVVSRSVRDSGRRPGRGRGLRSGRPVHGPAAGASVSRTRSAPRPAACASASPCARPAGQFPVDPECVTAAREAAKLLAVARPSCRGGASRRARRGGRRPRGRARRDTWTARDLAYWSERTGRTIGPATSSR